MDEPRYLDLRSAMPFAASSRESVLDSWTAAVQRQDIHVRYDAEVVSISGSQGNFALALRNGDAVTADHVVLAIGTQGNPRRLGVEGDQASDFVRYTLDDPGQFNDEVIVVVGAGDSAVENAVALGSRNAVYIVNRRGEFSRCKDGNLATVLAAINDPNKAFRCCYSSTVARLEPPREAGGKGAVVLDTPSGVRRIACHRVFARLGSIPPPRVPGVLRHRPRRRVADAGARQTLPIERPRAFRDRRPGRLCVDQASDESRLRSC